MPIKLSVLLDAIEAMNAAETLSPSTDPALFGRLLARLCIARIHIKVGIGDIDMIVTKGDSP